MKKLLLVISSAILLHLNTRGQNPAPSWNILDSNASHIAVFNTKILSIIPSLSVIDSSIGGQNGIRRRYKFANEIDTFSIEYTIFFKGQDKDLRIDGTPSVADIKMKGHYMALSPIYINLFEPSKTPASLKENKNLSGWFKEANGTGDNLYIFESDRHSYKNEWDFRIYKRHY